MFVMEIPGGVSVGGMHFPLREEGGEEEPSYNYTPGRVPIILRKTGLSASRGEFFLSGELGVWGVPPPKKSRGGDDPWGPAHALRGALSKNCCRENNPPSSFVVGGVSEGGRHQPGKFGGQPQNGRSEQGGQVGLSFSGKVFVGARRC
eukprot:FR740223.1.p1 GENE.FR740223.1~~FR740223.1.p1  ORF type:complete len:148 (-),score=36.47 FR740223.1:281-724(-)